MLYTMLLVFCYLVLFLFKNSGIHLRISIDNGTRPFSYSGKATLLVVLIGLFCVHAACAQWKTVSGLPAQQFYALCSEGESLYAATADHVYRSDNNGLNWSVGSRIHQNEDEVIDMIVVKGVIYVAMVVNGCFVSTDGGQSWQQHNTGLVGLGAKNLSNIVQRGDSLYVSTQGAGVFVKPVLPVYAPWSAFNNSMFWGNVGSLSTDGTQLLAGAGANATLSRNLWGNGNWVETPFDNFNGNVNGLLGALHTDSVWLGAGQQNLYRSTDNGQSWTRFQTGLGMIELAKLTQWQGMSLALLTKITGSFLRGTTDQGMTWTPFQPELPVGGRGNDLHAHHGKLYCARSNGLWALAPTVGIENPAGEDFSLGRIFPNPVTGDVAQVPFEVEQAATGQLRLFDTRGQVVLEMDLNLLQVGEHLQQIGVQSLANGVYICQLNCSNRVQTQRFIVHHSF